jgi:8-oxo-dGTP pyrophosphatase MutT (NUDIX family)
MPHDALHGWLAQRLQEPLPGPEAQYRLAVEGRRQRADSADLSQARLSAVLFLLYYKDDALHLPLIRRPDYEGVHGGQMALPGGRLEPQDPSLAHTALRETWEEVGVAVPDARLAGALTSLYIPPSRSLVHPFVAVLEGPPQFRPDPREVDRIFEIPLPELHRTPLSEQSVTVMGGHRLRVPAYLVQEQVVWGATAMMLSELLALMALHPHVAHLSSPN